MTSRNIVIKKDISIQIIRILFMFMIVLCHIFDETKNSILVMMTQ